MGQLGATATVNVQGGSAKLDAWIDFNGDGSWGGPLEQIADRVAVVAGNNTITFDVPSWAADGTTYARFRLSTAGNLGVGGAAADGEVEDYAVTCHCRRRRPAAASAAKTRSAPPRTGPASVFAADVDGDGDTDVLSASVCDDKIAWYENDGSQNFTAHTHHHDQRGGNGCATSVFAADVDGDGDTDVLSASSTTTRSPGTRTTAARTSPPTPSAPPPNGACSVYAADVDGDGDTDVLSASAR